MAALPMKGVEQHQEANQTTPLQGAYLSCPGRVLDLHQCSLGISSRLQRLVLYMSLIGCMWSGGECRSLFTIRQK